MSNYFRCDTSFMKNTNAGGREYSAKYALEIPNGFLGYLGDYVSGSTNVRTLLAPTSDLIKKGVLGVVMKPEINYKDENMEDRAIGIFRNPSNKPVPFIPFSQLDGIDFSQDYFDLTGKSSGKTTEIEIGDIFTVQANGVVGTQLKYASTSPTSTTANCYFKVIGVKNSHISVFINGQGNRFPAPYKMIQLEYCLV